METQWPIRCSYETQWAATAMSFPILLEMTAEPVQVVTGEILGFGIWATSRMKG